MLKSLKSFPLVFLLVACTSPFGNQSTNAITYQEAIQTPSHALGKTIIVGGPIISYNHTPTDTQIEIANAPLNKQNAPSIHGDITERAIIKIPKLIPSEQLQGVRISVLGKVIDVARMIRYSDSTVITIATQDYHIWRTTKPMFDPANKTYYGYTYKVQ